MIEVYPLTTNMYVCTNPGAYYASCTVIPCPNVVQRLDHFLHFVTWVQILMNVLPQKYAITTV